MREKCKKHSDKCLHLSHIFYKSICSSVASANLPINNVGYTLYEPSQAITQLKWGTQHLRWREMDGMCVRVCVCEGVGGEREELDGDGLRLNRLDKQGAEKQKNHRIVVHQH